MKNTQFPYLTKLRLVEGAIGTYFTSHYYFLIIVSTFFLVWEDVFNILTFNEYIFFFYEFEKCFNKVIKVFPEFEVVMT